MDQLKAFLRSLPDDKARERFAGECGTSTGYLRNAIFEPETRKLGSAICVRIEQQSGGKVRRWHLRPGDWWMHWPELIGAEGAPKVRRQKKAVAA
jgi:hypothetical protein